MTHEHISAEAAAEVWVREYAEPRQLQTVEEIVRDVPRHARWDHYGMAGRIFMCIEDVSPDLFERHNCVEFWGEISGQHHHLPDDDWLWDFLEVAAAVAERSSPEVPA